MSAPPEQTAPVDAAPRLTARQVARRRRAEALRRTWRDFRGNTPGMVGLVVLALFAAVALLAPVIADPEGLKVTRATGGVL